MNSINMLDNMDGITSTVSIGIIVSAVVVILSHNDFNNLYLASIIGLSSAILGFLYFNWHPSKMFMGDTGSQFLGIFLAAIGIMFFWNNPYSAVEITSTKKIITALIAFILPITDTTIVVINRLSKGRSPFIGGKDHTTHSLAYLGLKDNQVAWVYAFMSTVSIILVFLINSLITNWSTLYTILFGGYFVVLAGFFFFTVSRIKEKEHKSVKTRGRLKPSHL
jgi:UDP-GlcNAc:undecaprenyl-phosphate GlcNAc-1-phosphate transferase